MQQGEEGREPNRDQVRLENSQTDSEAEFRQLLNALEERLKGQNELLQEYESAFQELYSQVNATIPECVRFADQMVDGLTQLNSQLEEEARTRELAALEQVEIQSTPNITAPESVQTSQPPTQEVLYESSSDAPIRATRTASNEASRDSSEESFSKPALLKPRSRNTNELKPILVVDDTEINRVLIGHSLRNLPVTITYSSSAEDAIEKCRNQRFTLVLMDHDLNGVSGIEAAHAIHAFEHDTTIAALTEGSDHSFANEIDQPWLSFLNKTERNTIAKWVDEQI